MLALPAAASAILSNPSSMNTESSSSPSEASHGFAVSLAEPSCGPREDMNQSHLITNDLMSDTKTHDALDALAALASRRANISETTAAITPHQTSSEDEDPSNNNMLPPPPREALPGADMYTSEDESRLLRELPALPARTGRMRSASNPEGMEKWDSYSRRNERQHFVLPSSILEEELASTRKVLGESGGGSLSSSISGFQFTNYSYYDQGKVQEFTMLTPGSGEAVSYSTTVSTRKKRQIKPPMRFESVQVLGSHSSVSGDAKHAVKKGSKKKSKSPECSEKNNSQNLDEDEDVDESLLEPEELLRRARSRLLEDLSEENGEGEKSDLTLPHSLSKYKEVYNKHGRIGIYTPAERAAIITKFNAKRARRVWNKKIRYNCRKNLADRRMRIKGRFVKRSVEAMETTPPENNAASNEASTEDNSDMNIKAKKKCSTPPTSGSPLPTVHENEASNDEEMPDIDDDEADFSPTDDIPYRRTRRYTIT